MCLGCAKRRCERKEIITEIVETEIKYGRDLRIIQDEFYRPMRVAGLLTREQVCESFLRSIIYRQSPVKSPDIKTL